MQVFKFGGASVKDAESVKNVARIVKHYGAKAMVVVVSAMGKTTNALENMLLAQANSSITDFDDQKKQCLEFHFNIVSQLFGMDAQQKKTAKQY